jgi:hypothetical protein
MNAMHVVPAQAGTSSGGATKWIPACAGMARNAVALVVPAQAGTQRRRRLQRHWVPAFAGTTAGA